MSTSETASTPSARTPLQAYGIIFMGVIAVSSAAIFIKLAQNEGIPSLVIAAVRMTIASIVLTPIALSRHLGEVRSLQRRELTLAGISGIFLAVHFATWIFSLEYTNVLVSTVLVNSNPLWAAALEIFILRARLSRWVIVGLVIGLIGSIIVAIPPPNTEVTLGQNPLLGSLLAICGAITVAVYFIIGRTLRAKLSLLTYIWLVYSCSAIVLLLIVLFTHTSIVGYSTNGYLYLVAMALVPQLIGHTSFNYALKFVPATFVGISVQLEPAISAIIAFFLFSEVPLPVQILGSAVILAGVIFASLGQSRTQQT